MKRSGVMRLGGGVMMMVLPLICQQMSVNIISPQYVHQRIELPLSGFTDAQLRSLAQDFAQRFKRAPVASLYIETEVGRYGHYSNKGTADSSYQNWAHRVRLGIEAGELPIPRVAEVNVIGGDAVLRIRQYKRVERVPLTRRDPLMIRLGQAHHEVLEIVGVLVLPAADASQTRVECDACIAEIDIFARTKAPVRHSDACEIAATIQTIVRPLAVSVVLRRDQYFAEQALFPMLYAFDMNFSIPKSQREYGRAPENSCLVSSEGSTNVSPR